MQKRKPYALRSSRDDPRPEMVDEAIDDVQQALLEESTEKLINTVRHQSARASAICARNKIKALAPKISKNHKAAAQTFVEKDGIYCNDSDISVGTVIKRICLNNYHRYYDVDNSMRNMVKLGANGILDLSKEASIHEGLFSEDEFTRLKKQFKPCLVNDQSVLSKNNEELRKVEQLAKSELGEARALANRLEADLKGASSTLFDFYAAYIHLLQFHKYIFRTDIDITETDIIAKIYAPLLEIVMRDEYDIRLKWGESVGDSSGVSGERGFKVDLRIIYDTVRKSKNEVDLANVEVAKPTAPLHKIANDKAKLFIESKCVLDRIVSENRATTSTAVPALQISGRTVELYSLRLVKDGLYAAVCEGAATLPGTPKNVHALRQLYSLLARFKAAITRVADLELADDQDINDPGLADFTRPTWIPPRENGRLPPLPQYLYTSS